MSGGPGVFCFVSAVGAESPTGVRLRLVGRCGIFRMGGREWSDDMEYSYLGAVISRYLRNPMLNTADLTSRLVGRISQDPLLDCCCVIRFRWFTHTFVRYYPTYLLSVLIGSAVVKSAELHALQLPLVSVMAQVRGSNPGGSTFLKFGYFYVLFALYSGRQMHPCRYGHRKVSRPDSNIFV